jgi:hypothetical protein
MTAPDLFISKPLLSWRVLSISLASRPSPQDEEDTPPLPLDLPVGRYPAPSSLPFPPQPPPPPPPPVFGPLPTPLDPYRPRDPRQTSAAYQQNNNHNSMITFGQPGGPGLGMGMGRSLQVGERPPLPVGARNQVPFLPFR